MSHPSENTSVNKRRRTAWILTAIFTIALLMGTGPGVLIANRPETILGLPAVYAWGLFWYVVEVVVVIWAYVAVWTKSGSK
ncbi:MAG: hypothetical protein Tsb009_26140 [Planctomycetaceae bacterium]